MKQNRSIGILSKLRRQANLYTLKIAYYILFQSHLQYGTQLWGQKNNGTKATFQKLQNRVLRKITFKTLRESIDDVFRELKILKFSDILVLQNCLFMFEIEQNPKLKVSFRALHARDKHNYQTRSAAHNLLDIPLTKTKTYGSESVKCQCIKDWNSFKKKFPDIPENELSYFKIKNLLKKSFLDKY